MWRLKRRATFLAANASPPCWPTAAMRARIHHRSRGAGGAYGIAPLKAEMRGGMSEAVAISGVPEGRQNVAGLHAPLGLWQAHPLARPRSHIAGRAAVEASGRGVAPRAPRPTRPVA